MIKKLRERLQNEATMSYKEFTEKLTPGISNILGVRIPAMRNIAKEIIKSEDLQEFLKRDEYLYYEEKMLQAMIIGLLKESPEVTLEYVINFVPKIDSWAVCDTFCSGLKFTQKNKKLVWNFILPYFKSTEEYEIRFAVVMALAYFIDEEYIDRVIELIEINHEGYYAKMAVAWALSVCYVKFPEKTLAYLKRSKLDKWIYNKAIQKTIESLRIDKETKLMLKKMKK